MSLPIPTSLAAFDTEWMNAALERAGVASARVISVDAERIAVGAGFLGELARLHLDYATEGAGPRTVIAKIPTTDGGLKPLGVLLGVYERESRFYDEVAPELEVRVPTPYFNGRDEATDSYALLLEDVGNLRPGDHLRGAALTEARAAITTAARIHARWWDDPALEAMPWLPATDNPINMSLQGLYETSWPTVMDRFGHLYSPALRSGLEEVIPRVSELLVGWTGTSRTLTHNDFRLDNLFFDDSAAGAPDVIVLDFQVVGRGDGSGDLAPFLGCNLDTDLRRAHEDDLLRSYHETMRAAGAGTERFDDLVRVIDTAHLFWLINWGNSAVTADAPTERAKNLWEAVMARYVATVEDRNSIRYVDDLAWVPD